MPRREIPTLEKGMGIVAVMVTWCIWGGLGGVGVGVAGEGEGERDRFPAEVKTAQNKERCVSEYTVATPIADSCAGTTSKCKTASFLA